MRIFITGGAGFIGSAIVPKLNQAGFEVYVYDNLSFGNRKFLEIENDHLIEGDVLDENNLKKYLTKIQPNIIIHLAAIHFIPYCNLHPYQSADINIRGTINLLEGAKKVDSLIKVIFASTAAVYPIFNDAVREEHITIPLDIYGLSKLTGEHLCKKFHLETGVSTIVCRFFNAFGPNETNPHLIPEIENQLRKGNRIIELGNLTPKRDFIHTYDMAEAMKSLIELDNIGYDVFNIGRGMSYSVVEVVEAFSKILGEPIEIKVAKERVRKVERLNLLADVSKIKQRTGWEPKHTIEDGIKNLIDSWSCY